MGLVSYFAEHICRIKNLCCKELVSPCTDYFHQNHASSTEGVHASHVPQSAIPYHLLSSSAAVESPFSPMFSFAPRVLPLFCLFSITCGMFVYLYKLLLLPLDFMMHLLLFVVLVRMHLYSADGKPLLSQQEAVPHCNYTWWLSLHFPSAPQEIVFSEALWILP